MSEKDDYNGGEKFEQQNIFDYEEKPSEENLDNIPKGPPLFRDSSDAVDDKEGKIRYFKKGTCVKMYENERRLLFLQNDIIAQHVNDRKRDKEGFERFYFFTNAEFQGKEKDYVRAARGNFSVVFNLDSGKNILWIRAKDGSIRQAKKYLKENRIGMDDV